MMQFLPNAVMFAPLASRALLPWAHEAPFQTLHSVSHVLIVSNKMGNLLFARETTLMAPSDGPLIRL